MVVLNLRLFVLKNLQYKDKDTFKQLILVNELIDENYRSTGFYRLKIIDTSLENWSDCIASGEITVDEVNELNDAAHTAQKWLKDYTDKNFKELSDDEKLYMELGE